MEGLTQLEQAVLDKLLAGDDPMLVALRSQADRARVTRCEYTGVGFYCWFDVPEGAPKAGDGDYTLGDVSANIEGLEHGAGFVLFVRGGRPDNLEGFSYDEPWPDHIGQFELSYLSEPRELRLPGSPGQRQ